MVYYQKIEENKINKRDRKRDKRRECLRESYKKY